MRKRKDVFAVLPLKRNGDAGKYNEDLLNAGCGRRPHYVMRSLAERAIRMCSTVRMNVRHLDCAAKEEKSREKRYEQNLNVRIACP